MKMAEQRFEIRFKDMKSQFHYWAANFEHIIAEQHTLNGRFSRGRPHQNNNFLNIPFLYDISIGIIVASPNYK